MIDIGAFLKTIREEPKGETVTQAIVDALVEIASDPDVIDQGIDISEELDVIRNTPYANLLRKAIARALYKLSLYEPKNDKVTVIDLEGFTSLETKEDGTLYLMHDDSECSIVTVDKNVKPMFNDETDITGLDTFDLRDPHSLFKEASRKSHLYELILGKNCIVDSILPYQFKNIDNLTSVMILKDDISISDYAFTNCKNLREATVGSGVSDICEGSFYGCDNLKTITIRQPEGSIPGEPWGAPETTEVVWLPLEPSPTPPGPDPPIPEDTEHYGIKIAKNVRNSEERCEYMYDAFGYTPKTIDSIGSWGNAFFVKNNYPVMCKFDGTEDYELDHDDHTKKLDGTDSDVSNYNYQGNAMSCFDCHIWMKFWEDEDYTYFEVSNKKLDDDFVDFPYIRADGSHATKLYYPMFQGTVRNWKLRSIASGKPVDNKFYYELQRHAVQNGTAWSVGDWSHHIWMSVLMTLMGKNCDVQKTFGLGNVSSSSLDYNDNGLLMTSGQFYGTYSYPDSQPTDSMKAFYCENLYGNSSQQVRLGIYDNTKFYIRATPPYTMDGDISTYTNCGDVPRKNMEQQTLYNVKISNSWPLPDRLESGTLVYNDPVYYDDKISLNLTTTSQVRAIFGGSWHGDLGAGPWSMTSANVNDTNVNGRYNPSSRGDHVYESASLYMTDQTDIVPPDPSTYEHYGMKILKDGNNDENNKCIYLYDNANYTPKTIDSIGSWGNAFFVKNNYPVMCKSDGTEDYKLDPNDHSKKLDGSASDVSNSAYDGNAMSCFDCEIWMKIWEDHEYYYIEISNVKLDENFFNWPYKRYDYTNNTKLPDAKKLYYPMFEGTIVNGKLRSISGDQPSSGTTASDELQAARQNGSNWSIGDWSHQFWITALMWLMGKSLNVQDKFGCGLCEASSGTASELTFSYNGSLMTEGQFSGTNLDHQHPMKAFYCENLYGQRYKRTLGMYIYNSLLYATVKPEYYNVTGNVTKYQVIGEHPQTGIIRNMFVNIAIHGDGVFLVPSRIDEDGSMPLGYFHDKITIGSSAAATYMLCVGGRMYNNGTTSKNKNASGPMCMLLSFKADSSNWYIGASVYMQEYYSEQGGD